MQILLTNAIPYNDFIAFAFDGPVDVVSSSATSVVLRNPATGALNTFSGTGLVVNPALGIFSGTMTGWTTDTADGQRVITVTGISWSVQSFATALGANFADDNPAPLLALFSLRPVTIDARAYQQFATIFADGVNSTVTILTSAFGNQIQGGNGDDRITLTNTVTDGNEIYGSPGNDVYTFPASYSRDSWIDLVYDDRLTVSALSRGRSRSRSTALPISALSSNPGRVQTRLTAFATS